MHVFQANQALSLRVPNEVLPIEHYLRQPQRLVQAITDPQRIELLDDGLYRLKMRPLQFLGLSVEPTTDLRIWVLGDGTLCLEAIDCQVRGPDYLSHVNESFALGLKGRLKPQPYDHHTELNGQAHLTVQIDLPPPLKFMPAPMLDTAGRTLLSGILVTVKGRIERHLVSDYRTWAEQTHRTHGIVTPESFQGHLAR